MPSKKQLSRYWHGAWHECARKGSSRAPARAQTPRRRRKPAAAAVAATTTAAPAPAPAAAADNVQQLCDLLQRSSELHEMIQRVGLFDDETINEMQVAEADAITIAEEFTWDDATRPAHWDYNPTRTRPPYNGLGAHGIWLHRGPASLPNPDNVWQPPRCMPCARELTRSLRDPPDTERHFEAAVAARQDALREAVGDWERARRSARGAARGGGEGCDKDVLEADAGLHAIEHIEPEAGHDPQGAAPEAAPALVHCFAEPDDESGESGSSGDEGDARPRAPARPAKTLETVEHCDWLVVPRWAWRGLYTWRHGDARTDARLNVETGTAAARAARAQYVTAAHPVLWGYDAFMPATRGAVAAVLAGLRGAPWPLLTAALTSLLYAFWHETRGVRRRFARLQAPRLLTEWR